ncbi:PepSY domain-containing protein [Alteribacter populi]|uniref:PepSY domain-containing protein n=1 Tax=Alteribacter populi TaxID=2011011 RepID=UPI000BBAFE9B|nr:PepSY domain-containing protein [Alteribacter populi]
MKKLTIALTSLFVIGGTSALAVANSNAEDEGVKNEPIVTSVDLGSTAEESSGETSIANRISEEEAVAIAQEMLDGEVKEVELDRDDGLLLYEVEIKFDGEEYDFDIDARTGDVINIDDDLLKTPLADEMSVSLQQAKDIVKSEFPNGKIDDLELEMKKGRFLYEFEAEINDEDGDVYIDAETGELVHVESDLKPFIGEASENKSEASNKNDKISIKEAGDIALKHIGEGLIDDIELEKENGKLLYEVEIEYGNDHEVDVYVDAFTGDVVYVEHD